MSSDLQHVTADQQRPLVILAGRALHDLGALLERWGYQVSLARGQQELFEQLESTAASVVVLHAPLEESSGQVVYRRMLAQGQRPAVVFISAEGSIDAAVEAIKLGACDYLIMPADLPRLKRAIKLGVEQHQETPPPNVSSWDQRPSGRLIGRSDALRLIDNVIDEVAGTQANVLILGESGTGKELVARELHDRSRRANGPFVPVNMAAIPAGLAESILFGHEKGAFTGAEQSQIGVCKQADHGTLFLDEIGEMDFYLQAKLLRFVQQQYIQRVGSQQLEKVDVRIISATNRTPAEMLEQKQLREDLFYRLNVIPIRIPPLRDRRDDIAILANHFLHASAAKHGKRLVGFSPVALDMMSQYDWPGNVRQLENVVERLVIFARDQMIDDAMLRTEIADEMPGANGNGSALPQPDRYHVPTADMGNETWQDELSWSEITEKELITEALKKTRGNVVQAAKLLGLGQATVYRKIKRYQIPRPRDRVTR